MAETGFAQALDDFRKDQAKERAKEQRELEKKMADETKELESINKELKDANKDRKAELQRNKAEIDATRAERRERADHRSAVRRALDEEKGSLEKFKEELEAQGKKATDSKEYTKKSLELQKKELALRLREADSPSARKEIKQEQQALEKKNTKLLTTIAKGMTGIAAWSKMKIKGASRTLWNIIKGTFFAAFIIGLIAFLNSKYWETAKIKLAEFFVSLQDGLQFADIAELFGVEVENLKTSLKTIGIVIATLVGALSLAFLFPLGGVYLAGVAIVGLAAYFGWDGITQGFTWIKETFAKLDIAVKDWQIALGGTVAGIIAMTAIIKGSLKLLRKGLGLAGVTKFVAPTTAAGAAVAQAFRPQDVFKKGQVVKVPKSLSATGKVVWQGGSFARILPSGEAATGKANLGLTNKAVGESLKGKLGKGVLGRLMRVTSFLGQIPGIKTGIMGGLILSHLLQHGVTEKVVPMIGGVFGGMGGATLGAMLGGMVGLAGGPLAFFSALAGGLGGWFAGEAIGQAIGQFIIGKPIDAFNIFGTDMLGINKMLNDRIGGTSGRGISMPMGGMFEGGGGDAMAAMFDIHGGGEGVRNVTPNLLKDTPLKFKRLSTFDPLNAKPLESDLRMGGADPFGLRGTLETRRRDSGYSAAMGMDIFPLWQYSNLGEKVFGPMRLTDRMVSGIMSGGKIEPLPAGEWPRVGWPKDWFQKELSKRDIGFFTPSGTFVAFVPGTNTPSSAGLINNAALERIAREQGNNGGNAVINAQTSVDNRSSSTTYDGLTSLVDTNPATSAVISSR
tara:strand:- start:267 stop:2642 length:2376 start_codon:yes stop_codon:yes gene_type:complete